MGKSGINVVKMPNVLKFHLAVKDLAMEYVLVSLKPSKNQPRCLSANGINTRPKWEKSFGQIASPWLKLATRVLLVLLRDEAVVTTITTTTTTLNLLQQDRV